MTIETTAAPDIDEIRAAIVARMQELRPLVEECERLEKAEAALEAAERKLNGGRRAVPRAPSAEGDAPYGYKADGTPRKRPAPTAEMMQRRWATRRANAEAAAAA